MDYQKKTRNILKECGAFVDGGHFVLSGGQHADFYINKDALYVYPKKLDDICVMMADTAMKSFSDFDVVLAPAVAGVVLGQNIAYNLSIDMSKDVRFAYADKHILDPNSRTIRRGYQDIIRGSKVLLVDDIASTGATLVSLALAVARLGGVSVGAVVICDRGQVRTLRYQQEKETVFSEITIVPLVELDLQTFSSDDCPLCTSGRPIDTSLGEGTPADLLEGAEKVASGNEN